MIKMNIVEKTCENLEVDTCSSGSGQMADFGISGFKTSRFSAREIFNDLIVKSCNNTLVLSLMF
jgi:hypothetical protein